MNDSSHAGELLREVARLYTRAQRVVADCCQTTSTQCHILTELGRSGPIPMSELGTRLLLEKSWISRAVETLVTLELVAKQPNPAPALRAAAGTSANRSSTEETPITPSIWARSAWVRGR